MKFYATALIAATAFAQFDPTNCCNEMPVSVRCMGCYSDPELAGFDPTDCCRELPINPFKCIGCSSEQYLNGTLTTVLDVAELIDGVLVGALQAEHVDNLETCIKDIDPLVSHITTAVKDFEAGSFHKIAAGIDELGHFVSQVATTMEDCEKVGSDDVDKLKKMGDVFLHPKRLIIDSAKNVLLNGVSIYDEVKTTALDIGRGSFEAAGE